METQTSTGEILAQGFLSGTGERKLLLVNKRDRNLVVSIPDVKGGKMEIVDTTTGSNPPVSAKFEGETVKLGALGVAVVTLTQ